MSMDFSLPGGKRFKFRFRSCTRVPSTMKISACWSAIFLTSLQPLKGWINGEQELLVRTCCGTFLTLDYSIRKPALQTVLHLSVVNCSLTYGIRCKFFALPLRREESHQKYVFSLPLSNILTHQSVITTKHGRQGFVPDCVYRKHFNWRPDTSSPEFSPWECVIWLRRLIANCE